LLEHCYSGSDFDTVIGDLTEQYQCGRSGLWYWRQVLAIVVLGIRRQVVERPLVSPNRVPIGNMFAAVILVIAGIGVLLSDVWWILLFPGLAIAFVMAGALVSRDHGHNRQRTASLIEVPRRETLMKPHRGINSASVTGEGLAGLPGLIIAIAFVFLFLSIFLPRDANWILGVFFAVEVGAAALYVRGMRRDREAAERAYNELHRINEDPGPRPPFAR
jgi:hypothetical protein